MLAEFFLEVSDTAATCCRASGRQSYFQMELPARRRKHAEKSPRIQAPRKNFTARLTPRRAGVNFRCKRNDSDQHIRISSVTDARRGGAVEIAGDAAGQRRQGAPGVCRTRWLLRHAIRAGV